MKIKDMLRIIAEYEGAEINVKDIEVTKRRAHAQEYVKQSSILVKQEDVLEKAQHELVCARARLETATRKRQLHECEVLHLRERVEFLRKTLGEFCNVNK
jgi:hypothetical protein